MIDLGSRYEKNKKFRKERARMMNVIRNVSYDDQCPPVGEVIDIQQGVVGCWCVEWGEEKDEEIEDEKPAKCHNQACDTFWRFKKTKIAKNARINCARHLGKIKSVCGSGWNCKRNGWSKPAVRHITVVNYAVLCDERTVVIMSVL